MKQKLALISSFFSITIVFASSALSQWVRTDVPLAAQISSFAVAPSGTNLFAGTTDSGLYLASYGGLVWANTGLKTEHINALALLGNTLFAGVSDDFGDGGVYFSNDNGHDWTPTTGISTAVFALAVQGTNLFAGTYTSSGIFLTTNNGSTWSPVNNGINGPNISALIVSGSNIFAGTDQGIFLSNDKGGSWKPVNTGLPTNYIGALAAAGNNIFAGTFPNGVFLSTNNGTSWTAVNNGLSGFANSYVTALAANGTNIFAGTDSGVFLSTNNGLSWTPENAGLTNDTISVLAVCNSYLYSGSQFGGGVWERPLSEMISSNAVGTTPLSESRVAAYPNPLTQSTTISFSSPESGAAEVTIVNLLGSQVKQIFSGELEAGEHSFEWDASGMPVGMYECIVRMNGQGQHVPIVLE